MQPALPLYFGYPARFEHLRGYGHCNRWQYLFWVLYKAVVRLDLSGVEAKITVKELRKLPGPETGIRISLEVGEGGFWRIYWTDSEGNHQWINEKDEVATGFPELGEVSRIRPNKEIAKLHHFFQWDSEGHRLESWGAILGNGAPMLLLEKASWPPPFAWTRLGGWTCGTRAVWSPDEQWVFLPPPQEGETAFMEDWRGNLWSIVPLEGKLLMRSSREKCVPGKPL